MIGYIKVTLGIFIALASSRFIPHPPNFTSLIALSFYIPAFLGTRYLPALILSFIITDLIIGFHGLAVFTWGSVLLIGMFSRYFLSNIYTRVGGALLGACIFFLITNFGFWTLGSYEYSLSGFLLCYTLAIPFFGYTLLSTIAFSFLIEVLSIFFKEFKILN